ncbi:MAG: tetratricopeptide repeat protein [Gemmatimonadales bacterium]
MKCLQVTCAAALFVFIGSTPVAAQSVDRGIQLFNARKYSEAKAILLPYGENDAAAAYYLGRIMMTEHTDDKAARWFENAVQMSPRNATYYDWLARAHGRQAQSANKLRQPFLARKTKNAWETALAIDSDDLDVRDDLIAYYMQAPGFLGGSKEKARDMALEIKKRDAYRGSLSVVNLCASERDTVCVERELQDLTTTYPDSGAGYSLLAAFYANQNEFDNAFAVIDRRLHARPNELSTLFALGRTASLSGEQLDRGERALKAYIAGPPPENAPSPANAHYRLGTIYEKKGAKARAREEYRAALLLNPKLRDAQKSLAAL